MSNDLSMKSVSAGHVPPAIPAPAQPPAPRRSLDDQIKYLRPRLFHWPIRIRGRQIRRIAKAARRNAHERVHAFKSIDSIPESVREELTPTLIHAAARAALLTAKQKRAANIFLVPAIIIFLLAVFILLPYLIARLYAHATSGIDLWVGSYFVFVAIMVVVGAPLIVFQAARNSLANLIGLFWLAFGLFSCGFAAYRLHGVLILPDAPLSYLIIQSALVQSVLYVLGFLLIFVVSRTIERSVSSRLERRIPDAMFVDSILRSVLIVRRSERDWQAFRSKNELMEELERAARLVGEGVPRALLTADAQTDAWLKNHCQEIGAALRAKKSWVCMPKPDTRQQLENKLTACLVDAARGSWDSLERAERKPLSRQELRVRIGKLISGLFVALLPAAIYYLARQSGFLPAGALADYLGFGVVLWAVIALLLTIDSRFGEKIEIFQKIIGLLVGKGGGESSSGGSGSRYA